MTFLTTCENLPCLIKQNVNLHINVIPIHNWQVNLIFLCVPITEIIIFNFVISLVAYFKNEKNLVLEENPSLYLQMSKFMSLFLQAQCQDIVPTIGFSIEKFKSSR